MRNDGDVSYYIVQAKRDDDWFDISLENLFFTDLPHEDQRGDVGDAYRELLAPQSANSDLWQRYGIHGFRSIDDGLAALKAAREKQSDYVFRLALRHRTQHTAGVRNA